MFTNAANECPTDTRLTPTEARKCATALPPARLFCLRFDAADLVDQRPIVLLEPGDLGLAAARGKCPHQPFEQPGAESIQPLDATHVDVDARDGAFAQRLAVDQGLQISGIFCNPGAGGGDFKLLAVLDAFEQPVAHAANL